jgi:serine/threonine protein kinase
MTLIPALPATIHGYIFKSHIGSGGFGEVYRVGHPRFPEDFAAKVSLLRDEDDPHAAREWEAVEREVAALCGLNHPNIIRMYEYFREGNMFVMILEFCPGGDLQKIINISKGISLETFHEIAPQIVAALQFCHAKGIAHLDIKPSNILFDQYQRPKLADFGLALRASGPVGDRYSGSVVFKAPELIQRRPYDPFACDIWALGVTFLVMLGGSHPWGSGAMAEMKSRIIVGTYRPVKSAHRELATLIARMLELEPKFRLSIDDVRTTLSSVGSQDAKPKPAEGLKMLDGKPILLPLGTKCTSMRRASLSLLGVHKPKFARDGIMKVDSFRSVPTEGTSRSVDPDD